MPSSTFSFESASPGSIDPELLSPESVNSETDNAGSTLPEVIDGVAYTGLPGANVDSDAPRATASDRPGQAQPVPLRPVPPLAWGGIALCALLATVGLLAVWEWAMRREQLLPGDYGLDPSGWAAARRVIDRSEVPVVIVGDSRILFDTDLARFEALTGVRPLQLALPGSSGLVMLEDLAADPDFRGLAIVGVAEPIYFRPGPGGLVVDALARYRDEGPSQRSGYLLGRKLEAHVGFIDGTYRLSRLVIDSDRESRRGARSGYYRPWKVFKVDAAGQVSLWPRLETDPRLRAQARAQWMGSPDRPRPPIKPDALATGFARTPAAVRAIRARGGDVMLVRPPSSGPLRQREQALLPRATVWDPLLAASQVVGVHFDDHAAMRGLDVPEW